MTFSLSFVSRVVHSGSSENTHPHPSPLPQGEGIFIYLCEPWLMTVHPKMPLLTHPHPDPPLEGEGNSLSLRERVRVMVGIFIPLCEPRLTTVHPAIRPCLTLLHYFQYSCQIIHRIIFHNNLPAFLLFLNPDHCPQCALEPQFNISYSDIF